MTTRRASIALLVMILLAFGLRVFRLDFVPLRGDESFTVLFVATPFAQMLEGIRTVEPNPPLYYFILYTTVRIFGTGDFAARYVSVIFGVLAVPLLFQLTRRLLRSSFTARSTPLPKGRGAGGEGWIAILAACLLAVNPYQIWHSQDVRNYTLWPALSLLSLYLMLRALGENRVSLWVAYAGAALASLYTHYYEIFVLLFENLFVLFVFRQLWLAFFLSLWKRVRVRAPVPTTGWLVTQAVIAALYLPWLLFGSSRPFDYVDQSSVPGLWGIVERSVAVFSLGDTIPGNLNRLTPVFLGLAVLGLLFAWRRDRQFFVCLSLYLAIPTLGIFLLALWRPLFRERYLNVIAPGYYLTYAYALVTLAVQAPRWRQALAGLVLGGLLVVSAVSLQDYYFNPQHFKAPDWRGLARHLEAVVGPRDVIVQNYPDPGLLYYYHGSAQRLVLPDRSAVDTIGDLPVDHVQTGTRLVELLTTYERLWLLPQRSAWDAEGFVEQWLTRRALKLGEEQVAGFRLQTYARAPAMPPPAVQHPVDVRLGEGIRLLGYDLIPGDRNLQLTLYWQSLAPVLQSYTVFTHLVDAQGQIVTQQDQQPQAGQMPTTDWLPGDVVRDEYTLILPPGAPPGPYHLEMGMYELATLERLPMFDAHGQPMGDHLRLDIPP